MNYFPPNRLVADREELQKVETNIQGKSRVHRESNDGRSTGMILEQWENFLEQDTKRNNEERWEVSWETEIGAKYYRVF